MRSNTNINVNIQSIPKQNLGRVVVYPGPSNKSMNLGGQTTEQQNTTAEPHLKQQNHELNNTPKTKGIT